MLANSMPGHERKEVQKREEQKSEPLFLMPCPLFLTSDLPIFAFLMSEDDRTAYK